MVISEQADAIDTAQNTLEFNTDAMVIQRILIGHIEDYAIIMRRYNQRLFRTARSILKDDDAAEDAVQEAYISAYLKLKSYRSGNFPAWLTRITINEALMIKRKPDTQAAISDDNDKIETITAPNQNQVDAVSNSELASLIENAIDKLPDHFRSVFVLQAVQQLSVRETAESLDIPEATVKTRFHRARNLMQTILNQHIEHEGLHVFEFAGNRCDRIVNAVLNRLRK